MLMKFFGLCALAVSVVLTGILPSCSKSGTANGVNGMFVQTCSLGCASGDSGFQVSCAIVDTYVNKDVSIVFSQPINPATIDSGTFQIIDVNTGQVPIGTRFIDPTDPRKLVFRPAINVDLQGGVNFGFAPDTTYRIIVPGLGQNDPPPFIKSTSSEDNKTRMQCDIQTTLGVVDYVPGPPTVQILVDTIDPATQVITPNVDAHGATNVAQGSTIRFVFSDIMNPTTLADQVTHQPAYVSIQVDVDGDLATTQDQVNVFGDYTLSTDLSLLKTTMTFTAPGGLPSAGDPAIHTMPRLLLISVPSNVTDLGGIALANPSTAICTPQTIVLLPTTLPDANGENFENQLNLDSARSGADWGPPAAPLRLTRGFGGGSGRLGELVIQNQEIVTLNTDSTTFPLASGVLGDVLTNKKPIDPMTMVGDYPPADANQWPKVTVTDGIFEFSRLVVNPGGTLKITGLKPARVYSRGTMILDGIVDVSGATAPVHLSDQVLAEPGALGGPNAGDGGAGSSRMDNGGLADILTLPAGSNGVDIDSDGLGGPMCSPNCSPNYLPDGGAGGGVGRSTTIGVAQGGLHFPTLFPTSTLLLPTGMNGTYLTFTFFDLTFECKSLQSSGPGSGGSYGTDGAQGIAASPMEMDETGGLNYPDPTPGGATVPLNAVTRKLDADFGNLRGGAGGSGGGLSLFLTTNNNPFPPPCADSFSSLSMYWDHSGAAGGGGGGAIQLVSGQTMTVAGTILAKGGGGGSTFVGTSLDPERQKHAAPGGGGAGGAVRLQARSYFISGAPAIDIEGGPGGESPTQGHGGAGGAGLVRIEQKDVALDVQVVAPTITPFIPPDSSAILSNGVWALPRNRPETYTAAVSCWMKPNLPAGQTYFSLDFIKDDLAAIPPKYGWNMDVIYDSGTGEHLLKYRDPSPHSDPNYPAFPGGADFETFLGDMLNHGLNSHQGSYLAVRFQGAVSKGTLTDLCDVQLSGPPGVIQIVPGSLTPWVDNPADLNLFSPIPNMVRFTVVFDKSLAIPNSVPSFIKGITNLKIQVTPD
jgi:hypothetical protein